MKNLKFGLFTFIVIFLFANCEKQKESITIKNKVVDIIPDRILCSPEWAFDTISFDINEDSKKDVLFEVGKLSRGAQGHAWELSATICCMNNFEIATYLQNCRYIAYDVLSNLVYVSDNIGRINNDTLVWINTKSYLSFAFIETLDSGYEIKYGSWNNQVDKFFNLRQIKDNDTLYAWVRLNINYDFSYGFDRKICLTVKDFTYEEKE